MNCFLACPLQFQAAFAAEFVGGKDLPFTSRAEQCERGAAFMAEFLLVSVDGMAIRALHRRHPRAIIHPTFAARPRTPENDVVP
jgi:hypothetical protein